MVYSPGNIHEWVCVRTDIHSQVRQTSVLRIERGECRPREGLEKRNRSERPWHASYVRNVTPCVSSRCNRKGDNNVWSIFWRRVRYVTQEEEEEEEKNRSKRVTQAFHNLPTFIARLERTYCHDGRSLFLLTMKTNRFNGL